ncbi:MFS transporter [Cyanobacterium aponinum AL20118]|uniref:MFS transporter n=1 Tax=Cyanobacterium aponinum AL20115 TaxID=3090662 RepID=A0AAF1C6C2_9CHRO|nr:MFS transporter [Cyanobacterium aponinum]WPF89905.1 MFS transporter [Cyanobacterium aponinum AL20115]
MKTISQKMIIGLFFCVFLSLFSEVLLSPFYPLFFSKVFGVQDLSYAGYYIFICRLTVVLFTPIWGFLAKRFEARKLLSVGQLGTAVMTAMMALTQNIYQFTFITVLLLIFKSSYFLLYPLIIELGGEQRRSSLTGVYQAVFHGAIVSSTVVGAWVLNLQHPLHLFYGVALGDVLQFALCFMLLKNIPKLNQQKNIAKNVDSGKNPWGFIIAIGLVVLTFQLANNLVRPYFTAYVTEPKPFGVDLITSSFLFLIPSVMAIASMPFIRRFATSSRLSMLYTTGIMLLIGSLYLQGFSQSLPIFVMARVIYGFFLAITQGVLELKLFENSKSNHLHFNYGLITSFANIGHLGAPLLASSLVNSYGLAFPLIAAATLCILNLALAKLTIFRLKLSEGFS